MVEKFNFMDESGVQTLSTNIFKAVNTRIKERIATEIAAASYNDDNHVLSAKVLLGLIGNIGNYSIAQGQSGAIDGTGNTVLDKIKALQLLIGTDSDTASDDTIYGELADIRGTISGLTHLTYQVVEGDIETEVPTAQAQTDVIYLQHDEPSLMIARDGYLMHDANTRASAEDNGTTYYAYYDAVQDKVFKVTENSGVYTVTDQEWGAESEIYADGVVARVADNTYNLYVAQEIKTGDVVTDINWICVGDTSLDLANYWDKSDASVNELKNLILQRLTDNQIQTAVHAAFDATDPYDGSTSYLDSWLQSNP